MHLADLQPTHRPSLLKPPIFLTRQSRAAYYQGMRAKRSRTWLDRRDRFAVVAFQMLAAVVVLAAAGVATTVTVAGGVGSDTDRSWPVYQRKATFAAPYGGQQDNRRRDGRSQFVPHAQASGGWFQRPYPYHLDYYRMRYGGSYAPYFGNLYGPPSIYYGSPYYGDYSPYYGFNGYPPNSYPGGYEYGGPYCDGPGGYVEQPSPPADAD